MTLDEIARKYGTDKGTPGHGYTAAYEKLLGDRRLQPLKLLEIGVLEGASIRLWREWLPAASITACDLYQHRLDTVSGIRGVTCVLLDQSKPDQLRQLAERCGPWDVIIDDGSHMASHQALTWSVLRDWVKPGGLYVVEDLQVLDSSLPQYETYRDTGDNVLRTWEAAKQPYVTYTSQKTRSTHPALACVKFPDDKPMN